MDPKGNMPADPRSHRGDTDAIATAVAQFLLKTGLFDREAYVARYPDVAKSGLDPLHHYMRYGIQAGFNCTSLGTIARLWREVLLEKPATPSTPALDNPGRYKAAVYVSSLGNFFMTEIADVIMCGLREAGVEARRLSEKDTPLAGTTHHIVVAPHEFFVLGDGRKWATDDFVSRAVLFSTEQIQTQWFARSLVYLLRAKAVADMNQQTAAILRRGGVKAICVQPGHAITFAPFAAPVALPTSRALDSLSPEVRTFDVTQPAFAARPIDLLFLGSTSPKREKHLAAFAPKLAKLNTFIYATRMTRPLTGEASPTASPEVTAALLQRSKILLNIHRDEYTYFEWWRLMQAFWNRTLVVTEPCFPHPLYKPGIHYLEEAPRHLPHLVEWLVRTPEGQAKAEEIRARAHADFTTLSTARSAALELLGAGGTA
jgi:hypothetical protein